MEQPNVSTKDIIVITEYENPTRFRYITMEDLEVNGKFIYEIESQLESCCKDCNRNKHYDRSQYIIVRYYLPNVVKYLRGKVILFRGDGVYLVESLDYGFSFLCRDHDLWLLPKKNNYFHKHIEVSWGGLYGVAASGGVEWSQMAVDLLHHELEMASYLIFRVKYRSKDRQHDYGQMLIKSPQKGKEPLLDAAGYLLEQHCARRDHQFMKTQNYKNDRKSMRSVQLNEANIKPNPYVASVIQLMELQGTKLLLSKIPNVTTQNIGVQSIGKPFNNHFRCEVRNLKPPFEQLEKLEFIYQISTPREIPKSARNLSVVRSSNERSVNTAFTNSSSNSFESLALRNPIKIKTNLRTGKNVGKAVGTPAMQPQQSTLDKDKMDRINVDRRVKESKTSAQWSETETVGKPTFILKQTTLDKEKLDRVYEEMMRSSQTQKVSSVKQLKQKISTDVWLNKLTHTQEEQLLLAHSTVQVCPLRDSPRSLFHQDVEMAMGEMRIQTPLRMQRYAWPHLMKGNMMVAIADTGSGRSWCYLPTLCSLVMSSMQKPPTGHEDVRKLGPLAVLLTDSAVNAHLLSKHCSFLMKSFETKMLKVVSTHERSLLDVQLILLNSCGILVSTVCHWNRLIRETKFSFIDAHRLKHFILDDYDRMISAGSSLLNSILQHLQSLALPQLQLIIIAQQWHGLLFLQLVKRFSRNPLLLFADFLEAAIYGNIKLDVKLIHSSRKIHQLKDYLAAHAPRTRTVIYCKNDDELADLQMALKATGHDCIGIHNAQHQKIHELLLVSDAGQHPAVLPIMNLGLLVHYSLPASWSRFSKRFHTLIGNIGNILAPQSDSRLGIMSYMMLDESNKFELPRLGQFLIAHDIKLDKQVQQMVASCRQLTDQRRVFCHHILSRGECDQKSCNMRHFLLEGDSQEVYCASWKPGNVVSCKLIKVHNPVHFVMMAESYKLSDCTSWQAALGQSSLRKLSTALRMHMCQDQKQNLRMQQELSISEICVIQRGIGFQRVRIMDLSDKQLVTVQQLDEGRELMKVKPTELLQCDAAFKKIPPLAMEVRLCGLMPAGSDHGDWLPEATKWVNSALSNLHDNQHLQLIVEFAMLDTVYAREIAIAQHCPAIRTSVKTMRLHSEILEREFGQTDEQSIKRLRRMQQELFESQRGKNVLCDEFDMKGILGNNDYNDAVVSYQSDEENESDIQVMPQMKESKRLYEESNPSNFDDVQGIQESKESSAPMELFLDMLLKALQSNDFNDFEEETTIVEEILDFKTLAKRMTTNRKKTPTTKQLITTFMSQAIYCATIAGNAVRPKVRWHQTLTQIELIFEQQVPQYHLIHKGSVLIYQVQKTTPPQRCILNLLGEVQIISERQHGYQLKVKLAKQGPNTYWPTLLSSLIAQQHFHWLVYDTERGKLPGSNKCHFNWMRYLQRPTQISNSYSDKDEESDCSGDDEFTDGEI
ncbi:hypothetical protein KR044_001106 [Drosophila immigrans]|nr:hypothetical protein KR044_001106 [Drosophila immigrans]